MLSRLRKKPRRRLEHACSAEYVVDSKNHSGSIRQPQVFGNLRDRKTGSALSVPMSARLRWANSGAAGKPDGDRANACPQSGRSGSIT